MMNKELKDKLETKLEDLNRKNSYYMDNNITCKHNFKLIITALLELNKKLGA